MRKSDLSAHTLAMFERCPLALRFYVRREPGVRSDGGNRKSKGRVAHHAIELMAKRRARQDLPGVPEAAELLRAVDRAAVEEGLDPNDHQDLREVLVRARDLVDLSGLACAPEKRWEEELADGIVASGRFDLVRRREGIVVVDWKFGAAPPPEAAELAATPQAGLYLVAAHALWPDAGRWEIHFTYVRHRKVVPVRWTPELDGLWRGRGAATVRAVRAGYAPAITGAHCGDCAYRFSCSAWLSRMVVGGSEEEAPLLDDGDLLEERERASLQAKLGTVRRKDCDKVIRRRGRGRVLRAAGLEAKVVERESPTVAVEALLEIAAARDVDPAGVLAQAVTVSAKKAAQLVASPLEQKILEKWTSVKRTRGVRVTEAK